MVCLVKTTTKQKTCLYIMCNSTILYHEYHTSAMEAKVATRKSLSFLAFFQTHQDAKLMNFSK